MPLRLSWRSHVTRMSLGAIEDKHDLLTWTGSDLGRELVEGGCVLPCAHSTATWQEGMKSIRSADSGIFQVRLIFGCYCEGMA